MKQSEHGLIVARINRNIWPLFLVIVSVYMLGQTESSHLSLAIVHHSCFPCSLVRGGTVGVIRHLSWNRAFGEMARVHHLSVYRGHLFIVCISSASPIPPLKMLIVLLLVGCFLHFALFMC